MQVKHYDIKTPQVKSPTSGNWRQCWHGLYQLEECCGLINNSEYNLETNVFLSIIEDIHNKEITFMELGAGSADWCLALSSVVKNKLIKTEAEKVKCYIVEAEPQHIEWSKIHLDTWEIDNTIIPYAVSGKDGYCKFTIGDSNWYGQSIVNNNGLLRTLYRTLAFKLIEVQCFTLDTLVKNYNLNKIDIIHMDIQGSEYDVIKGAKNTIESGTVSYWLIGTHSKQHNNLIAEEMKNYYNLILNFYPQSKAKVDGITADMQDGMQLYKVKQK